MNRQSFSVRRVVRLAWVLAGLGLCGCAASSVWQPYPAQVRPLLRDLESGRPVSVNKAFGWRVLGRDRILYLMEQGRLAQLQGDGAASRAAYADAIAASREMDERAVVSASDLAAKSAALLLNDNAIPYAADGYERVMLHHGQALNYLFAGDAEGAGVEVRRAAAAQAEALTRRAREVEAAQEQARRSGMPVTGNLGPVYVKLDAAAGRVKNSFQNAYTFALSAVVRELLGDAGGAYIDYKKAAELAPANPAVRADVLRLAEALGMREDAARYRAMWPDSVPARVPPGQGELIVFFEDGFLPHKREIAVFIPLTGSGGWTPIALPVYDGPWMPSRSLAVRVADGPAGETAPVCDLGALAARALRERMPAILIRQMLRAAAKGAATHYAHTRSREAELAVFIMTLYNLISERADLRSWVSLPQHAGVVKMACPPGRRSVTLIQPETGAAETLEVDVRPGGRTVIVATRVGPRLTARAVAFGAEWR